MGGLALGIALSGAPVKLHAYGVCDDPAYFYREIRQMYEDLGALPLLEGSNVEDLFLAAQAKGAGYAISRPEELELIRVCPDCLFSPCDCVRFQDISTSTGVILDPVYSGKAIFGFLHDVREHPEKWKGKRVLFVHTGGLLVKISFFFCHARNACLWQGTYAKCDQLQPLVQSLSTLHRWHVVESM